LDVAVAATIDDPAHVHTWSITIPGPKHLHFALHGLPADYDLHVFGPGGQVAGESTNVGTDDDVVALDGAPAGTYLVYVNSPFGAVSDVPYGLLVTGQDVPPPPLPTPPPAPTAPPPTPTPAGRAAITNETAARVKELRTFRGHAAAVQEVVAVSDSRHVISAAADGVLKVWDLNTLGEVRTVVGQNRATEALAVSPDGKRIATGADDGRVRMYDAGSGREVWSLEPLTGPVRAIAFSHDGRYVAIGGDDMRVRLWDLAGGPLPSSGDRPERPARTWDHKNAVWALAFSPDGKFLITGSDDGTTRVWDTSSNGNEVRGLHPSSGVAGNVRAVAVSPDGRFILAGSERSVTVWSLDTGRELHSFDPGSVTNGVAFAPAGPTGNSPTRVFAAALTDRSVRLYDAETGRELHRLQSHSAPALAVAFAPDAKHLTSSGRDGTVIAWGLE
jgi:WD40 repeat protein